MRHIEVKYEDGTHAFVDDYLLESLIRSGQVRQFYRPSEKRWITVGIDPVREKASAYSGREKRRTGRYREMLPLPSSATMGGPLSTGRI